MNVILDAISPGKTKAKTENNPVPPPRKNQPEVTPRSKPVQKKPQSSMVITKQTTNMPTPVITATLQQTEPIKPILTHVMDSKTCIQAELTDSKDPPRSTITLIIPETNSIISTTNDIESESPTLTETMTSPSEVSENLRDNNTAIEMQTDINLCGQSIKLPDSKFSTSASKESIEADLFIDASENLENNSIKIFPTEIDHNICSIKETDLENTVAEPIISNELVEKSMKENLLDSNQQAQNTKLEKKCPQNDLISNSNSNGDKRDLVIVDDNNNNPSPIDMVYKVFG